MSISKLWNCGVIILTVLLGPGVAPGQPTLPGVRGVTLEDLRPAHPSRSYALVIGISNYQAGDRLNLRYAHRDAEEVYAVLISKEGGNYPVENVHRLIDAESTLDNMKEKLEEWLPSVAKDNDRVLIFFAGHGFVRGEKAYLAPHDLDPDNIPGTGYPMDRLASVIRDKIRAQHKILLTDACHTGVIADTVRAAQEETLQLNKTLLSLDSSLFSLTASGGAESSEEHEELAGGRGVFSYFVTQGMMGNADEDNDCVITADELDFYVRTQVRRKTKGRQNPASDRTSFAADMAVAFRFGCKELEPTVGTLVVEVNRDGVEVFLDGNSQGTVQKGKLLRLPGLQRGPHTIKGELQGYEPHGPFEVSVYPGKETTVSIRITQIRQRSEAADRLLGKGVKVFEDGGRKNYRRAAEQFQRALQADPDLAEAALYLARAYRNLYRFADAEDAFEKALAIQPTYVEARVAFGGMLLDTGNTQKSVEHLDYVVRRYPKHRFAYLAFARLADALRMQDGYEHSIRYARESIKLKADHPEAHFNLADSLRLQSLTSPKGVCDHEAVQEYQKYLRLSDLESSRARTVLGFWLQGFTVGGGRRYRPSQKDVWKVQRKLAYVGLGDCARFDRRFDDAIEQYRKARSYSQRDPIVHYALGLGYKNKAEWSGDKKLLLVARKHFSMVYELSPKVHVAEWAREFNAKIDDFLGAQ